MAPAKFGPTIYREGVADALLMENAYLTGRGFAVVREQATLFSGPTQFATEIHAFDFSTISAYIDWTGVDRLNQPHQAGSVAGLTEDFSPL